MLCYALSDVFNNVTTHAPLFLRRSVSAFTLWTTTDLFEQVQELFETEKSQTEVLHMECKRTGEFAHSESTHYESGEAFNGEVGTLVYHILRLIHKLQFYQRMCGAMSERMCHTIHHHAACWSQARGGGGSKQDTNQIGCHQLQRWEKGPRGCHMNDESPEYQPVFWPTIYVKFL